MNAQFINTVTPLLALLLLFCCVVLFSYSHQYSWLKNNCRGVLIALGMIPGVVGVFWGVWLYAQASESSLVTSASILLMFGAKFLISAHKHYEMRT